MGSRGSVAIMENQMEKKRRMTWKLLLHFLHESVATPCALGSERRPVMWSHDFSYPRTCLLGA